MAALHIINGSAERRSAVENCLQAASPGDTVLLVGNGVFLAVGSVFAGVAKRAPGASWCALVADVAARGISRHISPQVQQIDDGAFVDLVESHHPIVSWS